MGIDWKCLSCEVLDSTRERRRTSRLSEFSDIHVEGAYTAGLAAKKNAIYAKDSVDFVLTVNDPRSEDGDEIVAWGFEAKMRVTAQSAADEERNHRSMINPHIRIDDADVNCQ